MNISQTTSPAASQAVFTGAHAKFGVQATQQSISFHLLDGTDAFTFQKASMIRKFIHLDWFETTLQAVVAPDEQEVIRRERNAATGYFHTDSRYLQDEIDAARMHGYPRFIVDNQECLPAYFGHIDYRYHNPLVQLRRRVGDTAVDWNLLYILTVCHLHWTKHQYIILPPR